tara:strand:- start:47 stop:352 length:306 start_codon:yes stop_codon:yes gene_type:complete
MSSFFRVKAIMALAPNVNFSAKDGEIFIWDSDEEIPSEEAIQAKQAELISDYNAKQYQRDRAAAYPTWQEQMDMQYWDKKNGTTTWQEAIEAVKTKYPKGE